MYPSNIRNKHYNPFAGKEFTFHSFGYNNEPEEEINEQQQMEESECERQLKIQQLNRNFKDVIFYSFVCYIALSLFDELIK